MCQLSLLRGPRVVSTPSLKFRGTRHPCPQRVYSAAAHELEAGNQIGLNTQSNTSDAVLDIASAEQVRGRGVAVFMSFCCPRGGGFSCLFRCVRGCCAMNWCLTLVCMSWMGCVVGVCAERPGEQGKVDSVHGQGQGVPAVQAVCWEV